MACCKCDDPLNPGDEKGINFDEQRAGTCLDRPREGGVDFVIGSGFQYLYLYANEKSRGQQVSRR